MPQSKAHIEATARWEKENYFKPSIRFRKSDEKLIREMAEATTGSLNSFIIQAVMEKIEREKNKWYNICHWKNLSCLLHRKRLSGIIPW